MEIKGKVYCFFEQSGTFKKEFIKLGYSAEDYDIMNEFGETEHVIDLFREIEKAYDGAASIFDRIVPDDLIIAFFPCTYFSDMSQILHTWGAYPTKNVMEATDIILRRSKKRQLYYELCIKMLAVAKSRSLRLIMENPAGKHSFISSFFITQPTLIDRDRTKRGDVFKKPTMYWFINCQASYGETLQRPQKVLRVKKDVRDEKHVGRCNAARSTITSDYARNFICDFILGKVQHDISPSLFDTL